MNPQKKKTPNGFFLEHAIAAAVTVTALFLVISERSVLQSKDWPMILATAAGTFFCTLFFGTIGFATVDTFYTFNPTKKKGEEDKGQPKTIVERIIFWIIFLAIIGWLTLQFGGAI